jgi:Gpi18-like mannosyltransferase
MKELISKITGYFQIRDVLTVFLISLVHRVFILLFGIYLLTGSLDINANNLLKAFIHWDGVWYLDIVDNGYDTSYSSFNPTDPECNTGTNACQRNFAFFPLLPLVIKTVSSIINLDSGVTGVILANVFFILSCIILYKFVKQIKGAKWAKYSLLGLLTFPTTYIFSGLMTESLFLLLLVSSIYLAWNKKWLAAGLLAALLSATRNIGILIIIPFILIFLEQNNIRSFAQLVKSLRPAFILSLLLAPVGLITFMIYLNNLTGDPLAFINIQRYWDKSVNGISPLLAIPYSIVNWTLETTFKIHAYNLLYFLASLGLLLYGYIKKFLPISLLSIILWLLVPLLSGSMLALPRYVSVLFPLFMLIGGIILRYKWLGRIYLVLSFILSMIMLNTYVQGFWITV